MGTCARRRPHWISRVVRVGRERGRRRRIVHVVQSRACRTRTNVREPCTRAPFFSFHGELRGSTGHERKTEEECKRFAHNVHKMAFACKEIHLQNAAIRPRMSVDQLLFNLILIIIAVDSPSTRPSRALETRLRAACCETSLNSHIS